jgi:hypothetical protein
MPHLLFRAALRRFRIVAGNSRSNGHGTVERNRQKDAKLRQTFTVLAATLCRQSSSNAWFLTRHSVKQRCAATFDPPVVNWASAKSAAFMVQRDIVDALCEIDRCRRRLEQYQASALHLLSPPIISPQEARAMGASRP